MPEILKISKGIPEEEIINAAASIIARGGVIAYPTETFYGLGADATNPEAVRKIFAVKGRNFQNPVSVIIGRLENLDGLVAAIPESARKLMEAFWPGALTIVFAAKPAVSPLLTADSGKIGVRLSSHPGALRLAQKLGRPITATSANLSGAPECASAEAAAAQLGNLVDAILDLGPTSGAIGSTFIDVTTDPPAILREGVISKAAIASVIDLS